MFSSIIYCQWLGTDLGVFPGTPISSSNKTYRHDITEILLKVALNTINLTSSIIYTYIRERRYKLMYIGISSCFDDLVHTRFSTVITIGDVLSDTTVKQDRFLRYNTNLRSQPTNVKVFYVVSIQRLKKYEIQNSKSTVAFVLYYW